MLQCGYRDHPADIRRWHAGRQVGLDARLVLLSSCSVRLGASSSMDPFFAATCRRKPVCSIPQNWGILVSGSTRLLLVQPVRAVPCETCVVCWGFSERSGRFGSGSATWLVLDVRSGDTYSSGVFAFCPYGQLAFGRRIETTTSFWSSRALTGGRSLSTRCRCGLSRGATWRRIPHGPMASRTSLVRS